MGEPDTTDQVGSYAEFINRYSWDWWCHLTFAKAPSRDRAFKSVAAWINGINRKVFGNNYYKRGQGVRLVCAAEHQKLGAYHFHLLIAGCEDLHTDIGVASWKRMAGDAKIQVYDDDLGAGAARYIAKRVAEGDLEFLGPWSKLDLAEVNQLNAMR